MFQQHLDIPSATRGCWPKARRAGVDIDYVEGDRMVHVYPLLPIPGRAARQRITDPSWRILNTGPTGWAITG